MMTVHEVSEKTGVSVRALHHYDAIGLLKPAAKTGAGYRLYGEEELARLQTILFFRELEFPLGEIKRILGNGRLDENALLADHLELLRLKKKHLEGLIALAEERLKKGGRKMDFEPFDKTEMEEYAEEAKRRWGRTRAFGEFEEKHAQGAEEASAGLMDIFRDLGKMKTLPPQSREAQAAVQRLKDYITKHYYTCTDGILAGLGAMYASDPRFKANIDGAGGEGTAEFASRAIACFCGKD